MTWPPSFCNIHSLVHVFLYLPICQPYHPALLPFKLIQCLGALWTRCGINSLSQSICIWLWLCFFDYVLILTCVWLPLSKLEVGSNAWFVEYGESHVRWNKYRILDLVFDQLMWGEWWDTMSSPSLPGLGPGVCSTNGGRGRGWGHNVSTICTLSSNLGFRSS